MAGQSNGKSRSEKFPPSHQDGAVGFPMGSFRYDLGEDSFITPGPIEGREPARNGEIGRGKKEKADTSRLRKIRGGSLQMD